MQSKGKTLRGNRIFWPELTKEKAAQIAELNGCSVMTVHRRYTSLKAGDPEVDNITIALQQMVLEARTIKKSIDKNMQQILAA